MDHGHFVADGWGREHVAAFTHHEVEVHQAHELRNAEEHHNLEARRTQHPEIAARTDDHAKPGSSSPTSTRPGDPNAKKVAPPSKSKPGSSDRKPVDEKKN
jgi:hypothetical protein